MAVDPYLIYLFQRISQKVRKLNQKTVNIIKKTEL